MIDQILIINTSGLSLFDWSPKEVNADGTLISGFLTAMNMFAVGERGENMRKITLDPTTFYFEREGELLFVILTRDPEFEKVIHRILPEIKQRFSTQFKDNIVNFDGNVIAFREFNAVIDEILNNYGYLDYIRILKAFKDTSTIKSVLIIEKTSGEIVYIKSKQYLDRNSLGFQTIIFEKAKDRIINSVLHEHETNSVLITEQNRCLIIKSTPVMLIIQELQHENLLENLNQTIQDKKVQNAIKKPGKFIFENNNIFALYDEQAKLQYSNDRNKELHTEDIAPDVITLTNTTVNLTQMIFKETLFSTIIFTEQKIYAAFRLASVFCFIKIPFGDISELVSFVENMRKCNPLDTSNLEKMRKILGLISKFKGLFA